MTVCVTHVDACVSSDDACLMTAGLDCGDSSSPQGRQCNLKVVLLKVVLSKAAA
jgi:hypothetical protein